MKYEIIRTDINKTVLKAMEFADEQAALGQYLSALMLVGIIKMNDAGSAVDPLGNGKYRLSNGWEVCVKVIA